MVHFPEILTSNFELSAGFIDRMDGGQLIIADTSESFQIGSTVINLTDYFAAYGVVGEIALDARPNNSAGADIPIINGNYFLRFSIDGEGTSSANRGIPVAPMTFYLEARSFMSSDGDSEDHDSNPMNLLIAAVTISSGVTVVTSTMLKNADKLISDDFISANVATTTAFSRYLADSDLEILNWGRRPTSWSITEATVRANSGVVNGGANYFNSWPEFDRYSVQLHTSTDWSSAVTGPEGRFNFRVQA